MSASASPPNASVRREGEGDDEGSFYAHHKSTTSTPEYYPLRSTFYCTVGEGIALQ